MKSNNQVIKYFSKKTYTNGEIITMYIKDLINTNEYNNIIFIRTPSTGAWLDSILPDNNNITRIYYHLSNTLTNTLNCHKSTIIVSVNNLEQKLKELNNKYDLIVMDPYHEFNVSYDNFNLLLTFLNIDGCIVSHDCYPPNVNMSTPKFKSGNWCGQTYLSFVKIAYNNPDLFYGILNIDTGIGIISKKQKDYLSNVLDKGTQEQLLSIDPTTKYDKAYKYFTDNSKCLANVISLFIS